MTSLSQYTYFYTAIQQSNVQRSGGPCTNCYFLALKPNPNIRRIVNTKSPECWCWLIACLLECPKFTLFLLFMSFCFALELDVAVLCIYACLFPKSFTWYVRNLKLLGERIKYREFPLDTLSSATTLTPKIVDSN